MPPQTVAQNSPRTAPEPQRPVPAAPQTRPELTEPAKPSPAPGGAAIDPGAYVIGANDTLSVELLGQPKYSKLYPVRSDGILTIPHFGDVKAEGLTPLQLQKVLTEMFAAEISDPEVVVTVWDIRSKKYTVAGSVKRPGRYPLIGANTTVFEAINDAGGFLDNFSNQTDILILRGRETFHFDYRAYLRGENLDQNISLQDRDTIVVR
jgi:polysaccharide export outer membrane protein